MTEKYIRPSWEDYHFEVMHAIAKRASCDRGRSGCVITKNNHVISAGYVGAPAGLPSCDEAGHLLQDVVNSDGSISKHCVRTVHAEQNALCQAAKLGTATEGATMYCTMTPCGVCAKLIIAAGIKEVKCFFHYKNSEQEQNTLKMFAACGVKVSFKMNNICIY